RSGGFPRGQGCGGARAGLDGREVGQGAGAGCALQLRGPGGFADLAPRAGTEHLGGEGWTYTRGRRLLRKGKATDGRAGTDDPGARRQDTRGHRETTARRATLGARQELG